VGKFIHSSFICAGLLLNYSAVSKIISYSVYSYACCVLVALILQHVWCIRTAKLRRIQKSSITCLPSPWHRTSCQHCQVADFPIVMYVCNFIVILKAFRSYSCFWERVTLLSG